MTSEQKDGIIGIFQMGMAMGLNHPFEFFTNYIRTLGHMDYKKVPEMEEKAYDAMIAFMQNCAGSEEEQDFYNTLDVIKLNGLIDRWYKHHNKRMTKWCEENKGS